MTRMFRYGLLMSLMMLIGCDVVPKTTLQALKTQSGELASMLGNNHPWAGSWVLFWTGDSVELLQMEDRGFTISSGGDWVLTNLLGHYQMFNCLRDLGGDSYLYERLEGARVGVVSRRSYVTMKRYQVSADPDMLCDQLWRSRYFPTQDQAQGAEVNIPYASRETMTRFWTRRKMEGFPVCYFCTRWLFHCFCNRCKKQEPPQSGAIVPPSIARAQDMMDGSSPPKVKFARRNRANTSESCGCMGACGCNTGENKSAPVVVQPPKGQDETDGTPITQQPTRRGGWGIMDAWYDYRKNRKGSKDSNVSPTNSIGNQRGLRLSDALPEDNKESSSDDTPEVIAETKI